MSPVSSHLSEFHSIVKLNIRDRYDYLDYHKRWKKSHSRSQGKSATLEVT